MLKNLPAIAGDIRDSGLIPETEDPLEEGMATHSNILAWRIPWTEEPDGLQSIGSYRQGTITPSGSDESAISLALSFYFLICKMGQ